jgi:hypothetical protein
MSLELPANQFREASLFPWHSLAGRFPLFAFTSDKNNVRGYASSGEKDAISIEAGRRGRGLPSAGTQKSLTNSEKRH